jgi:hypothetical protein
VHGVKADVGADAATALVENISVTTAKVNAASPAGAPQIEQDLLHLPAALKFVWRGNSNHRNFLIAAASAKRRNPTREISNG